MGTQIQEFDFSIDVTTVLLWQYNHSESIQTLVNNKQAWLDANNKQFWEDWYTNVFNLATANDFGLAVWSYILGLPLFIQLAPDISAPIFGFDGNTTDPVRYNFDNGILDPFAGINPEIVLTTEQKRIVLQLRYFQLITRGAVLEVNNFMNYVFRNDGPPGSVYVVDGLDMSETYVFLFAIDPNLLLVLKLYDILPRPWGVLIKYLDASIPTFGFDGSMTDRYNFDNGALNDVTYGPFGP